MDENMKIFAECDKILRESNKLIDEEIAIKNKAVKSDADHLRLAEIQTRKSELLEQSSQLRKQMNNSFDGDVINETVFKKRGRVPV